MRRAALAIVLVLSSVHIATAQPPTDPAPSIGLPLPPIGLPLPSMGLPPRDAVDTRPPRPPSGKPPVPVRPIVIFGAAPYGWGLEPWQHSTRPGVIATEPTPEAAPPLPIRDERANIGILQLEVRPREAQLFVDGDFVGTWSDLAGEMQLAHGTHRIEARAAGYESLAFDARIVAGRTITYRGDLTRIEEPRKSVAPTSPSDRPPSTPTQPDPSKPATPASGTFYLIPGCYLGNIPPEQVKLPAGCDLTRVITHTPKH